ncbi:Dps family protein [Paenibacillus xerothermodurans]|uniref:DNA starvation/stationary phase protection protein n=1 Tax=Paenibacillus xerothermodurans TaxID=1977292 RepID=A0A2W1NQY1_PAEXE|nr:DNA starvation/stationary phase protection protein [Paenibacillus xerothermodurans]PZE20146.1 DNA starvation/stationary phase protection protein [Paenibacillus xerothermodurans]
MAVQTLDVQKVLNQQVATLGVLYVKLHSFHWYVQGPHFFTLHEKFEELYNEVTLHFDAVAERLLTIGGRPVATMKGMLEDSALKEAGGNEQAEDMVRILIQDLEKLNDQLKEGREVAEKSDDEVTADLLLEIQGSLEKHVWMLNSFLGKSTSV